MASELAPSTLDVRILLARSSFQLEVDFSIAPGFTILFGPSGAGKSTLLDCIAGVATPTEGRIAIGSDAFFDSTTGTNLSPQLRRVGYLFQSPTLFPHLTVRQNIEYGISHLPPFARSASVNALIQQFRIEPLASRKPAELSGGEAQRVALARTLITSPRVLLLDEPLSGLDTDLKNSLLNDLRAWNRACQIPILYVTHDRGEVDALGERVIMLDKGRVLQQGAPREILDAPRFQALATASGFENILVGTVDEIRPDDGVMRIALENSSTALEVPLTNAKPGDVVRVAIRAGDILLATELPNAISARNIFRGKLQSIEQRGAKTICKIDAGAPMEVHVTLSAARTLDLQPGRELWLIVKTYSCHIVR